MKERWSDPSKNSYKDDQPDSFEAALTNSERDRLEAYKKMAHSKRKPFLVDLNQTPERKLVSPLTGPMHTLIRNLGLCWNTALDRWHHVNEHFIGMGYPIDLESAKIVRTTCPFTRGIPAPPSRTRRSSANQVGNAMHVGVIGPVIMAVMFAWPDITSIDLDVTRRQLDTGGGKDSSNDKNNTKTPVMLKMPQHGQLTLSEVLSGGGGATRSGSHPHVSAASSSFSGSSSATTLKRALPTPPTAGLLSGPSPDKHKRRKRLLSKTKSDEGYSEEGKVFAVLSCGQAASAETAAAAMAVGLVAVAAVAPKAPATAVPAMQLIPLSSCGASGSSRCADTPASASMLQESQGLPAKAAAQGRRRQLLARVSE